MSFDFKTSKTAEYKNEYRYIWGKWLEIYYDIMIILKKSIAGILGTFRSCNLSVLKKSHIYANI